MARFELNLARRLDIQGGEMYFHYARIVLVSTLKADAIAQSKAFMLVFPPPEWHLTLTKWDELGESIEL